MGWADRVWTIADVMVEDVVTVAPDTPYKRLVELLWTHGISGLPVMDAEGALVGIISESDLLRRDPDRPEVASSLMTSPVVTVRPEAGLEEAAAIMRSRALKRLPVVDADGRLVGIVSRADLLKVFLRSEDTLEWDLAEVLQRYLGTSPDVHSEVEAGVVTLSGPVESPEQAERVTAAVRAVAGVVAVRSELAWPLPVSSEA